MKNDNISKLITKHKLSRIESLIGANEKIAIKIDTRKEETKLSEETSFFGGHPFLPKGISWPKYKDVPLGFLGQLVCKDIVKYDNEGILPITGFLSFFYDTTLSFLGEMNFVDTCKVIYINENEETVEVKPPKEQEENTYKKCPVDFSKVVTFPPFLRDLEFKKTIPQMSKKNYNQLEKVIIREWEENPVTTGCMIDFIIEEYGDRYEDFISEKGISSEQHQLRGHPKIIQFDNPVKQCNASQSEENGELLLQIFSDKNPGFDFGDNGIIYFCIEKENLQELKFDNVKAVLQSG